MHQPEVSLQCHNGNFGIFANTTLASLGAFDQEYVTCILPKENITMNYIYEFMETKTYLETKAMVVYSHTWALVFLDWGYEKCMPSLHIFFPAHL